MASEEALKKNKLHDQCKQVITFHNHLLRFYSDLRKSCPEFTRDVAKCVKYYQSQERVAYLTKVHQMMEPYIELISKYNENIFSNDYRKGALKLLPGLDFKKIFRFIDQSDDFDRDTRADIKKAIFNHLQSIYISSELALKQIGQFDKAMQKQRDLLVNMMKNLNLGDELKDKIDKIAKEEDQEEAKNNMFAGLTDGLGDIGDINKLGELLGEDNFIVEIAKDVIEELNIGGATDEPVDAINALFANNGERMQELVFTIVERVEKEIKSGRLNRDDLKKQAEGIHSRMKSVLGDAMPDLAQMQEQFQAAGGEEQLDPQKIIEMFSERYEEMSEQDKQEYIGVKDLMTRDMNSWNKEENELFNKFAKAAFVQRLEELKNNTAEEEATREEAETKTKKKKTTITRNKKKKRKH